MWRVSYGESSNLTKEELLDQRASEFQTILPGSPTPDQHNVTNFSPYKVHQRLSKSMRVSHFILVADAAHCTSLVDLIEL